MKTFTMTAATVAPWRQPPWDWPARLQRPPSEAHRPLTPSVACKPRATTCNSTGR